MNKLKFSLLTLMLIASASAFASDAPANVKAALKKMYPAVDEVAWSQDGGYYLADFMMNDFDMKVWMDPKAQWVMRQTDWEDTDELTPVVYNAFVASPYSGGMVEDVTLVEFPDKQAIIVIEVGMANSETKYQLFYAPNGELTRTRDVTYIYDILGPSTFF